MKKILIISYFFAPCQKIGAVRWTKLAKYLERAGISTDIITCDVSGGYDALLAADAAALKGEIHTIPLGSGNAAAARVLPTAAPVEASVKGIVNKIKRCELTRIVREKLKEKRVHKAQENEFRKGEQFCEKALEYIKEKGINPAAYDSVIISFGPVGCALLALRLKELYPEMRLIMDFRDPMNNFMQSKKINKRNAELQKKLCETADVVVTVSHGCAKKITKGTSGDNLKIIPNGYDVEDMAGIEEAQPEKFSFCFTGSLYDGKMDMGPLFKALSQLVKNGEAKREDMVFSYAGRNFAVLAAQAQKYGMGDILRDYGELERRECLALQRTTRQLVFCSWNFKNCEGILTGKVFEYMMMHRPIIGIVSGSLPRSEVRELIERAGGGMVFEQGDKKASEKALYKYLKEDYKLFAAGCDCAQLPSESVIAEFNYENIARSVAEII